MSAERTPKTNKVTVSVGPWSLVALLEWQKAPQTCKHFFDLLPFSRDLIHVRWSGEACWIPLGDFQLPVPWENATSYPAPGEILFYPGGYSETEILLPYGPTRFASKLGQLAGNHFLSIVEGRHHLQELGQLVLWQGAQRISFNAEG